MPGVLFSLSELGRQRFMAFETVLVGLLCVYTVCSIRWYLTRCSCVLVNVIFSPRLLRKRNLIIKEYFCKGCKYYKTGNECSYSKVKRKVNFLNLFTDVNKSQVSKG